MLNDYDLVSVNVDWNIVIGLLVEILFWPKWLICNECCSLFFYYESFLFFSKQKKKKKSIALIYIVIA